MRCLVKELLTTKDICVLLCITKDGFYRILEEKKKNIYNKPTFPDHVANVVKNKQRLWYKEEVLSWADRYRVYDDRSEPLLPRLIVNPVWPIPDTGIIVM